MFRFLTAGESHGQSLNIIIDGVPSGFPIDIDFINAELAKRQVGYGRGGRMKIETDKAVIKSGVRQGKTTGAPIAIEIINKDFENWTIPMSIMPVEQTEENLSKIKEKEITNVRPGHADFAGAIKYNSDDVRDILERSSARETAARVAVGAIAKLILKQFDITGFSHVLQIGKVKISESTNVDENIVNSNDLRVADKNAYNLMKTEIDKAKENGDTLGGKVEVIYKNLPIGLGSHVQWDRKLDGQIAQAVMSIQAVKAVEIGLGTGVAETSGKNTHDEIFFENGKITRKTNNAGGIEGGMTNGEDLVVKASMKAIPTMRTPLNSVNLKTKEAIQAHFERSDTCAVSACGVVADAMIATVLVNAFFEKFGSDNLEQIKRNYQACKEMLRERFE
ncbi:MAG: chorismate synthase [Candidatus Gastranaerophilales bacterium]|nr:chorismate synthase [Candidatus Gastranaerophilales bacterium]